MGSGHAPTPSLVTFTGWMFSPLDLTLGTTHAAGALAGILNAA